MSIFDCIAKKSHTTYTYKNTRGIIQDSNNVTPLVFLLL